MESSNRTWGWDGGLGDHLVGAIDRTIDVSSVLFGFDDFVRLWVFTADRSSSYSHCADSLDQRLLFLYPPPSPSAFYLRTSCPSPFPTMTSRDAYWHDTIAQDTRL